MSSNTQEVIDAINERDEAIKGRFSELTEENRKLETKNLELHDRILDLEQAYAGREFIKEFGSDSGPRPDAGKVIRSLLTGKALDGREREFHDEFANKSGLSMPGVVWLDVKALDYNSESPTSGGSNMVPQDLREAIPLLRQDSVIMQLGPRVVPATGNLEYPQQTGGVTTYMFDGDGEAITESEPVYGLLQLPPKFFGAYCKVNYRVALQTDGNAIRAVMQDITAGLGEKFDQQAIQGDGTSGAPTGVINQSGVNTAAWTSSPQAIAWADVVECEKLLLDDKALRGSLAYLTDPATFKSMKTTTKVSSDAGAGFLLDFEGSRPTLNGFPCMVSSHVPANTLIFANWNELIVAEYGAIGIATDESTDFAKGTVGIRGILPANVGVRHAVSFCISTGA